MKIQGWKIIVVLAVVLLVVVLVIISRTPAPPYGPAGPAAEPNKTAEPAGISQPNDVPASPQGAALIEFDIRQDMNLISVATFSEPPQFAIWLEDPLSHKYKTIVVTYRSAAGDLIGKAECPGCLPLWFAVYEREIGKSGMPTPDSPAPTAVTVPTPQQDSFKITRQVELGSRWICWMEMNLAGDFNKSYTEADTDRSDRDYSGQPPLVYRCEITAVPGETFVPQLYGQVDTNKPFDQMIQPLSDNVTTARDVFKSVKIRILRSEPNLPG